jgi:hypothetical protein
MTRDELIEYYVSENKKYQETIGMTDAIIVKEENLLNGVSEDDKTDAG